MTQEIEELMNGHEVLALDGVLERARRVTGNAPSSAPQPDLEVVATAKRLQFSSSDKRRILASADRCTEAGEIGALLRREGIYSSHLAQAAHGSRTDRSGAAKTWAPGRTRHRRSAPRG